MRVNLKPRLVTTVICAMAPLLGAYACENAERAVEGEQGSVDAERGVEREPVQAGEPSAVPARDSLGVEIVETDGQSARAASQATVSSRPELQIGVIDGDPAYMFSRISGIALLPEGRIAVLDGGSADIKFYDARGRIVARRGGRGQGPGELVNPTLLNTIAGDSLALFNGGGDWRFTFYSADGEGFRTLPGANAIPGGADVTSGTRALVTWNVGAMMRPGMQGVIPWTRLSRLVDLETGAADTLTMAPHPQVGFVPPGRMNDQGNPLPSFVTPPYTFPMAVAAREDRLFLTAPNEPSVFEYSWTGELRRIIRLIEPVNELTSEEFWAAVERQVDYEVERYVAVGQDLPRDVVRGAFDGLEPPAVKPMFQSLIVDNESWLWAQIFELTTDNSRTWLVFDAEGRGRGSVAMPEGLTVRAISRTHVAGVWRDEFDVEYVRLYRIFGRE